ncbi:MAG: trehalase-like domain-containing protein [Nocardioidaceae bacterium]
MTPGVENKAPDHYPSHVLREYALIADGERGAVVGPRGDIVWMCAPRWDSDAVFSALIGGRGGYAVTPVPVIVWGGYYEENSLIWHSRWTTHDGTVECRDALALPADPDRLVLLRRIQAVEGNAQVRVHLDLRGKYGARALTGLSRDHGIWTARSAGLHVRWSGADAAAASRESGHHSFLTMDLTLPVGTDHDLVLEISSVPLPDEPVNPSAAWSATETAWQTAVPDLEDCLAPPDTRHSYAVLRGMTSASGGMVAAATTSLPERAGAGRNYDYRYVWIRDQCYSGQAGAAIGGHDLLDDAGRFIGARLLEHGDRLAPAYTTTGLAVPDQRPLATDPEPLVWPAVLASRSWMTDCSSRISRARKKFSAVRMVATAASLPSSSKLGATAGAQHVTGQLELESQCKEPTEGQPHGHERVGVATRQRPQELHDGDHCSQ